MSGPLIRTGRFYSLRWRLIIVLGAIMLVCQLISVLWLWHESKEQIDLLVDKTLAEAVRNEHVNTEIHEAIASFERAVFVDDPGDAVFLLPGDQMDHSTAIAAANASAKPQR